MYNLLDFENPMCKPFKKSFDMFIDIFVKEVPYSTNNNKNREDKTSNATNPISTIKSIHLST